MSIKLEDKDAILKQLYDEEKWIDAQADAIELIEKQVAELEALTARVKELEGENAHRWVRCTYCDWRHEYMAGGEAEADKLANTHALTCEADPRSGGAK